MLNFQNPEVFFVSIILSVLLVVLLFASYLRDKKLLAIFYKRASKLKVFTLFLLLFVMIFSLSAILANPQEPILSDVQTSFEGDYVILIDSSLSTASRESPTSRSELEISKDITLDIMHSFLARFQIFVYSSIAVELSDGMSNNLGYFEQVLKYNLYTDMIPVKGSNLPNAIATIAVKKKNNSELYSNTNYIILFSDGDISSSNSNVERRLSKALEMAKEENLRIITVGVGSQNGWKVPLYDDLGDFTGEYAKSRSKTFESEAFVSYLNEENLKFIAASTDGKYFHYKQDRELINYLKTVASGELVVLSQRIVGDKEYDYIYGWIFLGSFFVLLVLNRKLI